jgi:hypothetical protein
LASSNFPKSKPFFKGFCPIRLGQKSFKKKVHFLGDLNSPKFHSEINWPLACWVLSDCWCEDKIAALMFTSTSSVKLLLPKKNCKMGRGRKFHSLKCPKNFERVDVFIVLTCLFCEHDKVLSACTLDHTGLLSLDGCRRVLTNFFYPQRKSQKFMWTRTTSLREKTWKLRSNVGTL